MAFECSYAGIPLCVPTPELQEWVDAMLPLLDVRDVQAPARFPGKNLTGLAWSNPPAYPTPRLGHLFWPTGASRWAIGRFIASGAQVAQIKAIVLAGDYDSAALILRCDSTGDDSAEENTVTADMYLLPPRPLGGFNTPTDQTPAATDFYLLTFVDVRYFWQWTPVSVAGGTEDSPLTWKNLVEINCATALGITLDHGAPDFATYGFVEPDSSIFANKENAALILDAALANTGRVLAANFDGTFTIRKIIDARSSAKTVRDGWKDDRQSGGPALALDSTVTDTWRKAVLPATVVVTFPQWITGTGYHKPNPQYRGWILDSYNGVYVSTVDMTGLSGYSQYVGTTLPWVKTFHDTAKAIYPDEQAITDEDAPDNQSDLDDLAEQIAKDYADALIARLDEAYPGIVPWTQDGLNDVLFCYRVDENWTRVQGKPWNNGVEEFQHGFGPLPNPEPSGNTILVQIMDERTVDPDTLIEYAPARRMGFDETAGSSTAVGGDDPQGPPHDGYYWLVFREQDEIVGTLSHMPWPRIGETMIVADTGKTITLDYEGDLGLTDLEDFADTPDEEGKGDATHPIVEFTRVKEELIVLTLDNVVNGDTEAATYNSGYFSHSGDDQKVYLLGCEIVDHVLDDPEPVLKILFWLLPRYQFAITGITTIEPLPIPGKAYDAQFTGKFETFTVRIPSVDPENPYDPDNPDTYTESSGSFPVYETRDFPSGVDLACAGTPPETTLYLGG